MDIFEISPSPDKKINVFSVAENIALVNAPAHHEIGTTGIFSIMVIAGSFDILGVKLTPASPPTEVCSTKEYSVKITPLVSNKSNNVINETYLNSLNVTENIKEAALTHFYGMDNLFVATLDERSSHFIRYIENYIDMAIFSNKPFEKSIISYNPDFIKCNPISINPEWINLGSSLTKGAKKVILCGGKGVGKSTMLRYLINRGLSHSSQVLVLDFDPGQTEFTVMGCISVVLVTKPLLGPNFSHLTVPVKCLYLGSISVSEYSKEYITCVKNIIQLCSSTESYRDIPWFINTMGFVRGLGITLLKEIITHTEPTDVVQINSKNKDDNFPERLTPQYVLDKNYSFQPTLKYKLHSIASVTARKSSDADPVKWGVNPAKKRGIVALSYFFRILNNESLNFLECVPYRISIEKVRVIVTANDTPLVLENFHKLSCINGNMVALCYSENKSEVMEHKGFGIVRGVDFEKEEIFICTPMNESELEEINIVHMNSAIQLPPTVYKKQLTSVQNALPYMSRTYPSRLNQLIKKTSSRLRPYSTEKNA